MDCIEANSIRCILHVDSKQERQYGEVLPINESCSFNRKMLEVKERRAHH